MKAISRFYQNRSIRTKLLLYFITLILLPIVTLGIIGNIIYSQNIEEQATTHTSEIITQVNKNIEVYIQEIDKIMDDLANDPDIISFLYLSDPDDQKRIEIETEIRRIFFSITESYDEVAGILIANDYDLYISNELFQLTRDPISRENWYELAHLNPDLIQLISKPIGRNISSSLNYTTDDVVAISKAIKDPETGVALGTLLVDFKLETIEKIIEGNTLGKSGFIFIMDDLGNVVYTPVNPIVYRVNDDWLNDMPSSSFIKRINDSRYQIIYGTSNYTKWKTIGVFSLEVALKEVERQRYFAIIIGGITLTLAVLVAFYFTSSIVSPLKRLKKLMQQAEKGNLDIVFDSKTHDEISDLGSSFNNMIKKLNELIHLVYVEQKSKREAELKTLQAQIKPHFLYNTLDTIQYMINEGKSEEAADVIDALTTLFRIGLSRGREMISLDKEIEHVESYLFIQKTRYEEKLNHEIIYEERLSGFSVVKLIIQPLVENAIYHGIKQKRGNGKITIKVEQIEKRLCISVMDNGAGIPKERLKLINEVLAGEERLEGEIGYGLFNVNERIRLTFGEQYGLTVESNYGKGTTVRIWHPLIGGIENYEL